MLTVELFIIAKIWKQSKYSQTVKLMKMVVYTYAMKYQPRKRKNDILPLVKILMQLEGVVAREVSQRKRNIVYFHLQVQSKT